MWTRLFVSSLLEEAVQLQHIIDDLQDLAAADAGALRLHPEPVRIEELLAHAVAAHQAQADAAGVALTVTVADGTRRPSNSTPTPSGCGRRSATSSPTPYATPRRAAR